MTDELLLTPEEMAEKLSNTLGTKLKFESKLTDQDLAAFKDEMRIEILAIAKAQLAKAEPIIRKQVIEEIKRELEKKFAIHAKTLTPMIEGKTIKWWQAFWGRYKEESNGTD